MGSKIFCRILIPFLAPLMVTACQPLNFGKLTPDFSQIQKVPSSIINFGKRSYSHKNLEISQLGNDSAIPLKDILGDSIATKNQGSNFVTAIKYALDTDPEIISKQSEVEAKLASVGVAEAQKDFQVTTTLYGGLEDVTDNTKGVALAINASRLVFDGGEIESQITASLLEAEASKMDLAATVDERALALIQKWLDVEKYKSLQIQINKRLDVLDPLIVQLEKVAEAGIGDVGKVTAAQKIVSAIRVEKTTVAEGLAQAQLELSNAFGALDSAIAFDYDFITDLVPSKVDDRLVQNAPLLKSRYASYRSNLARVEALRAKDGFDVGFEARATRPFAGSSYDSDESIGFVGRKTLFNGGMLDFEIRQAEALAEARLAEIKATHRSGARVVKAAIQNVESMEKAILLARESAKLSSDEIVHLRQQLVIGGSTLDSVLAAEARLYEAESKEVDFLIEKYKSEAVIVSTIGLLSTALGF